MGYSLNHPYNVFICSIFLLGWSEPYRSGGKIGISTCVFLLQWHVLVYISFSSNPWSCLQNGRETWTL